MQDVIFWGGTGQAKVLSESICDSNFRIVAIVDNRILVDTPVDGVPVLYGEDELDSYLKSRSAQSLDLPVGVVAIGGSKGRDRLAIMNTLERKGVRPLAIIHSQAFVARDAVLGDGVQILAMSAVCSRARLGNGVIINTSALVDHDCLIGDGVHIGPGAKLAGEVIVSKYAFVGLGAVILPRLKIGKGAIVGAGAVVTKDVLPNTIVVGNPARVIKS